MPYCDICRQVPALPRADTFLRWNGFYLEVEPQAAYDFMVNASKEKVFKFGLILEWIFETYERLDEFEDTE